MCGSILFGGTTEKRYSFARIQVTSALPTILTQAVLALAIALFSAWLTVYLALRKFRAEKIWERKVVAYERVIEAIHKSKRFSSEHLDATYSGRDLPEARDAELRRLAGEAKDEICRAADIGSFTISEQALGVISTYERELGGTKGFTTWHERLEHDYCVTDQCLKNLIAEAKRDLRQ